MRIATTLLLSTLACSPASASISSSLIDDFSGPSSAANGFSRSAIGGAFVAGGVGILPAGGGFGFNAQPPSDAYAFNGISLEVSGNLGQGILFLSILGEDNLYFAVDVPLNSYVSGGHAWITFNQIDAEAGNAPNTIAAGLSGGFGIIQVGLEYRTPQFGGGGPLTLDNLEFRVTALPAPGVAALLGVGGMLRGRRRR